MRLSMPIPQIISGDKRGATKSAAGEGNPISAPSPYCEGSSNGCRCRPCSYRQSRADNAGSMSWHRTD
nr:MAG TPA: hypothetical protein [Caudoviricetes sp.]